MTAKLPFRIYDEDGALRGTTAYAEDAAFIVTPGGTIRAGRKTVWRECPLGDNVGDGNDGCASESADYVAHVVHERLGWRRA